MTEDPADLLRLHLAQDPDNGRLLLNDRGRMQAVAADLAAANPALRNAMHLVVGQQSFSRVLLADRTPTPEARADLLKRLDEQGIRAEVAEACVDLLTAAFLGSRASEEHPAPGEVPGETTSGTVDDLVSDVVAEHLPAGWHDDPNAPGGRQKRYWDGTTWTEHTHDPQSGTDADPISTDETTKTLTPPKPARRRPVLIGGIAASVLLAFVIWVIVASRGPEGLDPLVPTAAAPPVGGNGGTADTTPEVAGLSDAKADLANAAGWIDADTCESAQPESVPRLGIECQSSGGSNFSVFVTREVNANKAELDESFRRLLSSYTEASETDDVMSETGASWGSWASADRKTTGSILFNPDSDSFGTTDVLLVWTENETLIWYKVEAEPSEVDKLKSWWRRSSEPSGSAPRASTSP